MRTRTHTHTHTHTHVALKRNLVAADGHSCDHRSHIRFRTMRMRLQRSGPTVNDEQTRALI